MPRRDLSLAAGQLDDLLLRCHTVAVAVSGEDGFPRATLARVRAGGRDLRFEVAQDDPVAAPLRAEGPACVVADTWPSYEQIQGLIVRGRTSPGGEVVELHVDRVTSFDFGKAAGPGPS
ncbi:MAG: hypothetical protein JWL64_150 [Frankiales bacterium]|nr:hypothetical protein [Frankiales bacterium]